MITFIVVDDETPAREELKYLLGKYNDFELAAEASDGKMAIELCKVKKPQVVFLDIQMPGYTGIEVAEKLLQFDNPPYIVFVTAYDSYAIEAFNLHVIDYLLKPIENLRLEQTIDRIRKNNNSQHDLNLAMEKIKTMMQQQNTQKFSSPYITVCDDDCYYPVSFKKIKYAYTIDKKTYLLTEEGKYCYKNTLTHFEKSSPGNFLRIHRSFVVNIHFIAKIDKWFNGTYKLTIDNEKKSVSVSRQYAPEFRKIMKME
jgi:DNA-binding LytR/AlgR family response regulator